MKVSIRADKYQKGEMTIDQFVFASERVSYYMKDNLDLPKFYKPCIRYPKIECKVYRTKTKIQAVVSYIVPF